MDLTNELSKSLSKYLDWNKARLNLESAVEIDVAYVHNNTYWPIEVKWRNQLRPADLKHIKNIKSARIFSKVHEYRQIDGMQIEPLPLALIKDDINFNA